MISIRKQRGMTALGWILIILLGIFFALVGLKLFPIYRDSMYISSVLKDLSVEPEARSMSPSELTSTILKRLDINSVYNIQREDIFVEKNGDSKIVSIEYEVRTPLMGNIDLVVYFDKSVEVP